ncbi:MAG: lyase family protein [Paracoccus sp. (in: a-proteobacteria)]
MLRAEVALSRVQGRLGIIPADAAAAIIQAAGMLRLDPGSLAGGVARAGIAAQPLIGVLKKAVGEHAAWEHFGATSQDIVVDTGLMIRLRDALVLLRKRLTDLVSVLAVRGNEFAGQPVPAHPRFQLAAPTTLGAKIVVWRVPLMRQLQRLYELQPRLLKVSLYGAAGTSAALGPLAVTLRQGWLMNWAWVLTIHHGMPSVTPLPNWGAGCHC